jgi:hypothetical protein
MKTSSIIIAVLLALTLAVAGSARVEIAEVEALEAPIPPQSGETAELLEEMQRTVLMPPWSHGDSGTILIVPAAQIKATDLLTIMEDMTVMSRILDNSLRQAGTFSGRSYPGRSARIYFDHETATEGIYLDGYGALFTTKVDIPLLPPHEVQTQEVIEDLDPVWEKAKREIYTPQEDARRSRRTTREHQQYDPEEVEDLKRTLTRALKHASNIRKLKPTDWVILTVIGESDQPLGRIFGVLPTQQGQRIVIKDNDKVVKTYEYELNLPGSNVSGASSSTVLTLRVKKSHIDAFAENKLALEQFKQQVQIFIYSGPQTLRTGQTNF